MNKVSLSTNVILNTIRQGCSILFPLVTLTYVAQKLGSENYGIFNTVQANISYFFLVAGLGVSTYAVREGAKIRKAEALETFCCEVFSINMLSTLFTYAVLAVYIVFFSRRGVYTTIMLIMSAGILLTTLGADWVNTLFEDYKYLTIRYILFQIVTLILILLLVRDSGDLIVYSCLYAFSLYGGFILNIFYIRKYVKLRLTFRIDKRHIAPIIVLFANAVAVIIYVNSDITILSHYCSDSQVGIYGFSTKLYTAIKQIINAFIIVTIPRISSAIEIDRNRYYALMRKLLSALFLIILPVTVFTSLQAKELILCVGGEKYVSGYVCLIILSFALMFAILGSYVSNNIVLVNRREKISLAATMVSALLNITLNFLWIPKHGIEAAALTTLIAEVVCFLIQLYCSRRLFDFRRVLNREWVVYIVGLLVCTAVCLAFKRLIPVMDRKDAFMEIAASAGLFALLYGALLLGTRNSIMKTMLAKLLHIIGR